MRSFPRCVLVRARALAAPARNFVGPELDGHNDDLIEAQNSVGTRKGD
jgi:hypothetical protein